MFVWVGVLDKRENTSQNKENTAYPETISNIMNKRKRKKDGLQKSQKAIGNTGVSLKDIGSSQTSASPAVTRTRTRPLQVRGETPPASRRASGRFSHPHPPDFADFFFFFAYFKLYDLDCTRSLAAPRFHIPHPRRQEMHTHRIPAIVRAVPAACRRPK